MAIYRQLQTNLWQDEFILELEALEKYVYTYLMTNPRTTQCGIYRLVKKLMELELGLEWETIYKILKKLMDNNKIAYCEETGEIMLINWSKYNFINSRNTILCINKELKEVKNKEFIGRLYTICLERNYPVKDIFNGVVVDGLKIENKEEEDFLEAEGEEVDSLKADKEGLSSPFEAPYKALGEEEIKEEYINKSYNKQKVTNKSISRILLEFSKNIKKASKDEIEKFIEWRKTFEEEFIIKAIKQAVKYKAKHIGYIESIIKNWAAEGITTMKELMKKFKRNKPRVNSEAYRYLD
ncbi:DnaD domain protein [Clostridium sp. PL3]|uniref:DnaD domain protein n=1 Tax=Clostridium thailandense TaxID=2794346 RepID=A0A949TUX9_9CLOT|nr:DnaD domain protein [Clostridium thailandense]MBV7271468.1 DnaD domain protein [Clostridium thailandense]